jgi:putative FmdB family regulatory protein
MPLYEFKCKNCRKVSEQFFAVAERPDKIKCSCGKTAKRVLSSRGAILTDGDVKWLASACQTLQKEGERPLQTRSEYKRYLKDNGLIAAG